MFFLSDGNPNENTGSAGQSLNDTVRPLWNTFVNNPTAPITVTAIGVGDGLDTAHLSQVDVDGSVHPGHRAQQFSDLIDTLVTLVGNNVTGKVLANGDGFGADGGRILSITFDNVTYTWDGATTIAEGERDLPRLLQLDRWKLISVDTLLGGHFTFYFAPTGSHVAGEWVYAGPHELAAEANETFTYVLTDNDGDHRVGCVGSRGGHHRELTLPISKRTVARSERSRRSPIWCSSATASSSTLPVWIGFDGGNETVTLGVLHGTLKLTPTSGLTVTGNDTSSVTVTGSVANINAALNGMTYKGTQDY